MSLPARFEATGVADDRRSADRRALRLAITASLPESTDLAVTIHDLSETGLLLETRVPLAVGQQFQAFLPLAGAVEATVVWSSHDLYGCQFEERVPRAAVSAALLQGAKDEAPEAGRPQQDVLLQLRDLSARIEQVGQDLDRTIEQLSSDRPGIPSLDPQAVLAADLPQSRILPPREAELPLQELPERYVEEDSFEVRAAAQPVVIISLILAVLAALMLMAALLAFPLSL